MDVLKFGGTSVGTVESINQVIEIISKKRKNSLNIAVVYSAMGGVTNKLIEIGKLASQNNLLYLEILKSIEDRHINIAKSLTEVKSQSVLIASIKGLFNEIEDLLKGITFIKELTNRTLDLLLSFGERLSTTIITFSLNDRNIKAEYVDAREIIKTNSHFGFAEVDFKLSNELISKKITNSDSVYCITGFIYGQNAFMIRALKIKS